MPITVFRLLNPQALAQPDLAALFDEALHSTPIAHAPFRDLVEDFAAMVANPDGFLFYVAADIDKPALLGLIEVALPRDRIITQPQVGLLYAKSAKAKKALIYEASKEVRERGFETVWAINGTTMSDEKWARVFGLKTKRIGSILEFPIPEV